VSGGGSGPRPRKIDVGPIFAFAWRVPLGFPGGMVVRVVERPVVVARVGSRAAQIFWVRAP
jgi:hypothetical protein